ncbi:MBL fold metallo-hydrolase [Lysinibacillus endophyticus]|uniref:MBL fold metallo-hydrolase n=1 Tax=Ureibacillus endophyticus TaxID=1978490 RepID=UPI0031357203
MIQYQNSNFTVFQSLLYKTTSTVIQTNDCIIVVDPNLLPFEVEAIRAHVDSIRDNRPIYVIFTHSDWDHVIGYGAFQDATVIASSVFAQREDIEDIVKQMRKFDDQYYLDRPHPILYPSVDIEINEDGQFVTIGDTFLTFYQAEGHTNDGIYCIIEPLGIWITGDYLSDIEFPFIYDSSSKYEATLLKTDAILKRHLIDYLIPGHGHITDIVEEIKFRKMVSLTYIKELREAIEKGKDSQNLLQGYNYLSELQSCHEQNIELMKKELNAQIKQD